MSHPTTRVLAMLELLQARHQLSGAELAAGLGVDQRTIRRYALRLADLGIPVTAERGRYGGYRLLPGYRLPRGEIAAAIGSSAGGDALCERE